MKMFSISQLSVLAIFAGLVGCGGDNLSEEQAQQGWNSALTEMSMVGAKVGQEQSTNQNEFGVRAMRENYEYHVQADGDCTQGGKVSIDGTYSVVDSRSVFDYTTTFKECTAQDGTVIDGQMKWATSMVEQTFTLDYTGSLDFSGTISGDCDMNLHGSTTIGDNSYSYSYTGTICGYDVQDMSGSGTYANN